MATTSVFLPTSSAVECGWPVRSCAVISGKRSPNVGTADASAATSTTVATITVLAARPMRIRQDKARTEPAHAFVAIASPSSTESNGPTLRRVRPRLERGLLDERVNHMFDVNLHRG